MKKLRQKSQYFKRSILQLSFICQELDGYEKLLDKLKNLSNARKTWANDTEKLSIQFEMNDMKHKIIAQMQILNDTLRFIDHSDKSKRRR